MSVSRYLKKMQKLQSNILAFLEDDTNDEDIFNQLIKNIKDDKICGMKTKFKSFIHLLLKISNNHHRDANFFEKIFRIITNFEEDIKKFSNLEKFNLFKSNKRILLFSLEKGIVVMDKLIAKRLSSEKYKQLKYLEYFSPEIQPFSEEKRFRFKCFNKISDSFYEKRIIGENDSYICQLIRDDSVEEFISHVTFNNYSLNSIITPSIYETNSFLIKNQTTLIEYSAFFGSIQIFNFLRMNSKVKLSPTLWLCAIHSKNAELIHLLEENFIQPKENSYIECFKESIKCHHIDFSNYIRDIYLSKEVESKNDLLINNLKYYNFLFMENEFSKQSLFNYLCKYDYSFVVNHLLKKYTIDINRKII